MSTKKVVFINDVRLSFPDIWKPGKPMNDGDTPKYGASFLFGTESPQHVAVRDAMIECAKAEYGANWQNVLRTMDASKKCLRKGDDSLDKAGAVRDGYTGNMYVVARNEVAPEIVGPKLNADGSFRILTQRDGKPYGGCQVNAKVEIVAMKAFEKVPNQVFAKLLAIQFYKDGVAFGGAMPSAEGFGNAAGADDIPDAMGGGSFGISEEETAAQGMDDLGL
jgi:hypothetical protein